MKRTEIVMGLIAAAACAVTVGCKQDSGVQTQAGETSREASAQPDKMKQETKEAIDATKDYAYAQKAEYAAKIRVELAALNQELDQLATKAESSTASAKSEARLKVEALRAKVAKLGEKLDDVQGATESTWEDFKSGVKAGYDDVKDSFAQARQWLSEKIAP